MKNISFSDLFLTSKTEKKDELSSISSASWYPVPFFFRNSLKFCRLILSRRYVLLSRSAETALNARSTKYELVNAIKTPHVRIFYLNFALLPKRLIRVTEFGFEFKIILQGYKLTCKNPLLRNINKWADYYLFRNLQIKCSLESNFYVFMQFLYMLAVLLNINIRNAFVAGVKLLQAGKL